MSTTQYSIAPEIIARHENEILAALPKLYPNEAERTLVEQVFIPQFRTMLQGVFAEFNQGKKTGAIVIPREIPNLCIALDKTIAEQGALLTNSIFQPIFTRIQSVREQISAEMKEDFYAECRQILAKKDIKYKSTLLAKGSIWFKAENFEVYGKGTAFAGAILGTGSKRILLETLEQIADKLGFQKDVESVAQKLKKYKKILAEKGVKDRNTLLEKGRKWFLKETFGIYGKGTAFAGAILGRTIYAFKLITLHEIADKLSFPKETEVEMQNKYRKQLAEKNITDRDTLLEKGSVWFKAKDFGAYGKGTAFAGVILGRMIYSFKLADLHEIADKLFADTKAKSSS